MIYGLILYFLTILIFIICPLCQGGDYIEMFIDCGLYSYEVIITPLFVPFVTFIYLIGFVNQVCHDNKLTRNHLDQPIFHKKS